MGYNYLTQGYCRPHKISGNKTPSPFLMREAHQFLSVPVPSQQFIVETESLNRLTGPLPYPVYQDLGARTRSKF
jgi:hypothetical protein